MTAADAGLSYRTKALAYLRTGRITVVRSVTPMGGTPREATVRVLPAMEGQPHRTVNVSADGGVSCTCGGKTWTSLAGSCPHIYATAQVLGRGGPR